MTEFPGPIQVINNGRSVTSLPVAFEDSAATHLLLGSEEGFLQLWEFQTGADIFLSTEQIELNAEVVRLLPWENNPGDGVGVVVAVRNPDQLVFVVVRPQAPKLSVVETLLLEEDPGGCAFLGETGAEPLDMAVTYPGIDAIDIWRFSGQGWALAQTLAVSDSPRDIVGLDLDGDLCREAVLINEGVLSENLSILTRDDLNVWSLGDNIEFDGVPKDLALTRRDVSGDPLLLLGLQNPARVEILEPTDGSLTSLQSLETTLPVTGVMGIRAATGQMGVAAWNVEHGLVDVYLDDGNTYVYDQSYFSGCFAARGSAADFNGDGLQDMAFVGFVAANASVLMGDPVQGFWGYPALSLWGLPGSSLLGTYTGDALEDLVVACPDSLGISLFPAQPDGRLAVLGTHTSLGYQPGLMTSLSLPGQTGLCLAVEDLNSSSLHLYSYTEPGGFVHLDQLEGIPELSALRTGDCDGDGVLDIAIAGKDECRVDVIFGVGDGTFLQRVSRPFTQCFRDFLLVDLNDDNREDLAGIDASSRIWTSLAGDDRTFAAPGWLNVGVQPSVMQAADLDGDLDLDIVVGNRGGESLTILENNGNGQLIRRVGDLALLGVPQGLDIADVDDNLTNDIVVSYQGEGSIGLVFGNTDWDFEPAQKFNGSLQPKQLLVGDYNLDGNLDVLSLDLTLELGISLLNLERIFVAVHPTALSVGCHNDQIEVTIQPDRPGAWTLELGHETDWTLLAADGRAILGDLEYSGRDWVLRLPEPMADSVSGQNLRLTVGIGSEVEALVLPVQQHCGASGLPDPSPALSWDQTPWPNPFNPQVNASFRLGRDTAVQVTVHDVTGRRVAVLADGWLTAGTHDVIWDGRDRGQRAATGVYLLHIRTETSVLSQKLLLLK